MKVFDFGKNTYQYEIDFKFDCISTECVKQIVENLHISKKLFSAVSKEAGTNYTQLTEGQGTPQSPVFQVKIGLDRIVIWAGWHVSYEKWQQKRASIIDALQILIEQIPVEMVLTCVSQSAFVIPAANLIRGDQIRELAPVLAFYARGVPQELLENYNALLAFGDKSGKEALSFLIGPSEFPQESKITFDFRWNAFDSGINLEQNVIAHAARADGLLDRFSSGLLSLLVKN